MGRTIKTEEEESGLKKRGEWAPRSEKARRGWANPFDGYREDNRREHDRGNQTHASSEVPTLAVHK